MNVNSKIERMIEFMKQDTDQRIIDIQKKSKEQADLISQQLTITETKKVEQEIDKEVKDTKQDLQVHESGLLNSSRLEVLRVRDEIIQKCIEKCKAKVSKQQNYEQTLGQLAVQGAELLDVTEVVVQLCDEDDKHFSTIQSYASGKGIKVSKHERYLDKKDYIGGLNIYTSDRKIYIENNYQKRLLLSYKKMAPEISATLFQDHSALW